VRVFGVEDPTTLFDDDPGSLPAYTLIGPSFGSSAYRIEPFEWQGRDYLVVTDLGGSVQLWDLTNLLDPGTPSIIHPNLDPTVTDYADFMLAEWRTPPSVSDDLPNTVWGIDIDLSDTTGGPEPDEVHVYVLVARRGIEVLRFEPSGSPAWLVPIDSIETPSGSGGISIRNLPTSGETDLFLSGRNCGLRVFTRQ